MEDGRKILKMTTEIKIDELSSKENEIMNLLIEATNLFNQLPDKHPTAIQEWCFYVHGLQMLI